MIYSFPVTITIAAFLSMPVTGFTHISRHASDRGPASGSFLRASSFEYRLRVCNAYPYQAALDVYRGESTLLTTSAPMPYKACQDFQTPLQLRDKVEFKVGDTSTGTFTVSDLPSDDALLLLVVHRHDTLSTAMAFESHVFANIENAQVAILDTYKGETRATVRIEDDLKGSGPRSEELRYNSVVSVNPGKYRVSLFDQANGKRKEALDGGTESELIVMPHESYVVLRTGVEAQQGDSFPEEIIVFPNENGLLKSHSGGTLKRLAPALLCLIGMVAMM